MVTQDDPIKHDGSPAQHAEIISVNIMAEMSEVADLSYPESRLSVTGFIKNTDLC